MQLFRDHFKRAKSDKVNEIAREHLNTNLLRSLAGWSWAAVVVTALALSNWSLFVVGRHFGLPVPLAGVLSVSFDGASLVCANLALSYAREHGGNGAGPRAAVLLLAGISAWLNTEHASLLHQSLVAHVLYACPPVTAILIFELQTRYQRRDALRAAGRIPDPRPVLGAFIWSRHPRDAHRAMSVIAARRLDARMAAELGNADLLLAQAHTLRTIEQARMNAEIEASREQLAITSESSQLSKVSKSEAIRQAYTALGPDATVSDLIDWLKARNVTVDSSYVYSIRARLFGQAPELPEHNSDFPLQVLDSLSNPFDSDSSPGGLVSTGSLPEPALNGDSAEHAHQAAG